MPDFESFSLDDSQSAKEDSANQNNANNSAEFSLNFSDTADKDSPAHASDSETKLGKEFPRKKFETQKSAFEFRIEKKTSDSLNREDDHVHKVMKNGGGFDGNLAAESREEDVKERERKERIEFKEGEIKKEGGTISKRVAEGVFEGQKKDGAVAGSPKDAQDEKTASKETRMKRDKLEKDLDGFPGGINGFYERYLAARGDRTKIAALKGELETHLREKGYGSQEIEETFKELVTSGNLESYAYILMQERLKRVLEFDKAGDHQDIAKKHGFDSLYDLARAVMEGEYVYDKKNPSGPNASGQDPLVQLDSLLRDLGERDKRLEELNKTYENASDTTIRVAVEEIQLEEARRQELDDRIAELTRGIETDTGRETFASATTPESGMLPIAQEFRAYGAIKEHDGGRILEAPLKSGEPIFLTLRGGEPVFYFTIDRRPNGNPQQIERSDPPAKKVNEAQSVLILRRLAEESTVQPSRSINMAALAPVLLRMADIGPDPELFMDAANAHDIEMIGRMFIEIDLNELGVIQENGALDSLAFETFAKWLRKEAGGEDLDTVRRRIGPEDIRAWKEAYNEDGVNAVNVSIAEIRSSNTVAE